MEQTGTWQKSFLFPETCGARIAQHNLYISRSTSPLWIIRQLWWFPIILTQLLCVGQQCVPQCPITMLISWMDHHPGWLINEKQVMILIDDCNIRSFHICEYRVAGKQCQ